MRTARFAFRSMKYGADFEGSKLGRSSERNGSLIEFGDSTIGDRCHFSKMRDPHRASATSSSSTLTATTAVDGIKPIDPFISNPLICLSHEELSAKVEELARANDLLDHVEILQKGAFLAQHSEDWCDFKKCFTSDERSVVELVERRPWQQITWSLTLTIAAASFGAVTLGWDQGVLSGANLHYPQALNIDPDLAGPDQVLNNWVVGFISAGPFLGAAVLAVWLCDILNHHFGRRGTLMIAAVFLFGGPLGSAFCRKWYHLLICRLLLGCGIGFLEVTAPVFAAEAAPQEIRGALTITFQLFTAFGILLGSSVSLIFEDSGRNNWRLMLGSPLIPVPFLVVLLWLSPESARWYIKWGKLNGAYRSLVRLRHHELLAARDLCLIYGQMVEEQHAIGGARNIMRFGELFYKNRVRQSTLASCISHLAQVLSGINIVCFFSSTIFTEITNSWGTGGSSTALTGQHAPSKIPALWGSWGFGMISFMFTFPALWLIDRIGRRALMLITLPSLSWTLIATALVFLRDDHHQQTELGLVLFFVYLYTALYSAGMGPVAFCYSAESAAQTHREMSVALAAFVNNAVNALMSIVFFRMHQVFTTAGSFGFYAGTNVLMFLLVLAFVPETKQLSLEQLDAVFAHKNRDFMKWVFVEQIPYLWNRYARGRKNLVLRVLDDVRHCDHGVD